MAILLTVALILRQFAVAALCLLVGLFLAWLFSEGLTFVGVTIGQRGTTLMGVGGMLIAWFTYRRFFRKTILLRQRNDQDAEIIM